MLVNAAHFVIPKVSFLLSYISNPLFIYLISSRQNAHMGPYRYLLFFFAVFNMLASLADLLVPVSVHNYRYACVTFLADGLFLTRSYIGESSIAYRCAFISGTYAILNVHFMFRYLVLKRGDLITHYFLPYGFIFSILYVLVHWIIWALIVKNVIYSASEVRDYVRISFENKYHEDIENINFVAALFSESSPEVIRRSWTGILMLTTIASYSICLYFVLGYKIITGINLGVNTMSQKTARMQKQLFKALTIQTVIPICVSFLPCSLSFYGAALNINLFEWMHWAAPVAVSMFPFLDPMAIIFFLPALRRRLGLKFKSNTVTAMASVDINRMETDF